ncbi:hypothetical protein [Treponema succinifaciens]|uniref:hypothetical protein n=1 Tax=Treponema succinifaciens TaxID=167 RepID=UPI003F801FBB
MTHKRFSEKEILKIRNDIFIQDVVPILEKNGFVKSPFKTACFGRTSNNNIFIYEMCRLRKDSRLEFVITKISRYDRYIKIYINAFKPYPPIKSVYSLKDYDSTNYEILPNSGREKKFHTDKGRIKRTTELKNRATAKVNKIESFFDKWYSKYCPYVTKWNGDLYDKNRQG